MCLPGLLEGWKTLRRQYPRGLLPNGGREDNRPSWALRAVLASRSACPDPRTGRGGLRRRRGRGCAATCLLPPLLLRPLLPPLVLPPLVLQLLVLPPLVLPPLVLPPPLPPQ